MTTHLGKEGIIKVGTQTVAEVRSWTLNTSVETVDASHLGDDWKVHKATQKSWHGSLSCFWDETDFDGQGKLAIGESVTLVLYPAGEGFSAFHFTGLVLVTGIDYAGSHNGLIEASIAFQGSGLLASARNYAGATE
jgi:predicted secreted protein